MTILSLDENSFWVNSSRDQEHKRFGEEGFENIVQQVAAIERQIGIEGLALDV